MKRTIRAALGVVLVALAVPAVALATAGGPRGHGLGHRHHHSYGATGATGAGGTGAPTVSTYQDGVLTITLPGGGTLQGTVGDRTRFVCVGAHGRFGHRRTIRLRADTNGSTGTTGSTGSTGSTGTTGSTGSTGTTGSTGSTGYGGYGGYGDHHHHGHGDGNGYSGHHHHHGRGTPPAPCDSSRLVPGATLLGTDVAVTANGVLYVEILLPAVQ